MKSSVIGKNDQEIKKIHREIMENLSLDKIREIKEIYYLSLADKNSGVVQFQALMKSLDFLSINIFVFFSGK